MKHTQKTPKNIPKKKGQLEKKTNLKRRLWWSGAEKQRCWQREGRGRRKREQPSWPIGKRNSQRLWRAAASACGTEFRTKRRRTRAQVWLRRKALPCPPFELSFYSFYFVTLSFLLSVSLYNKSIIKGRRG